MLAMASEWKTDFNKCRKLLGMALVTQWVLRVHVSVGVVKSGCCDRMCMCKLYWL